MLSEAFCDACVINFDMCSASPACTLANHSGAIIIHVCVGFIFFVTAVPSTCLVELVLEHRSS